MIKILKNGIIPKKTKTIYKATCAHCKCEFEFESEDCDYIEKTIDGALQIECPTCHLKMVYLKESLETREVEVE